MSYTKKGTITKISEKQMFDAGSGKLTFRIDTGEQYSNIWEFELFKGKDHVEHLDNFTKYNKVGDSVDVEFNIKSNAWTNPKTNEEKIFTSLSCWKVEKVTDNGTYTDNLGTDIEPNSGEVCDTLPF